MKARKVMHEDGVVRKVTVIRVTRCCGKQGYVGRKQAIAAAKAETKATGELIHAYKCSKGGHCWHIGHPPMSRGEYVGRAS